MAISFSRHITCALIFPSVLVGGVGRAMTPVGWVGLDSMKDMLGPPMYAERKQRISCVWIPFCCSGERCSDHKSKPRTQFFRHCHPPARGLFSWIVIDYRKCLRRNGRYCIVTSVSTRVFSGPYRARVQFFRCTDQAG